MLDCLDQQNEIILMLIWRILLIYLALTPLLSAQDNPIELGNVKWIRNYEQAVQLAVESGKPIFLLFQEVPGCANCTRYGTEVLSNPKMVGIIEEAFVPLAIHNNKDGHDRDILNRFNEPTWNNPVVRIIDNNGDDLVPRIGDFRSYDLLITSMKKALTKSDQEMPKDLIRLKL